MQVVSFKPVVQCPFSLELAPDTDLQDFTAIAKIAEDTVKNAGKSGNRLCRDDILAILADLRTRKAKIDAHIMKYVAKNGFDAAYIAPFGATSFYYEHLIIYLARAID